MKGHGRETINLGLADALPEDQNMLPIPQLLQDVIDRLVCTQVLTVKPDSCIIDVFGEGDHSQPQIWPSSYWRHVSVLFLTECKMTFGKLIEAENFGDHKGSLKLSHQPGSPDTARVRRKMIYASSKDRLKREVDKRFL